MEQYQKHIAPNPKATMIHASLDESREDALKWARRAGFPWLTVLFDRHEAAGLAELMEVGAPETVLVDKEGKVLSRDEDEAFEIVAAAK